MPNAAKPARLIPRTTSGGKKFWYILDRNRQSATGCGIDDLAGAEKKLAQHIATRFKPNRDSGRDPATFPIAEILINYQHDKRVASPEEQGRRIEALIQFFGDQKPVAALNKKLCRDYARHRGDQSARRELEDLRAALGHALGEEVLEYDFRHRIELPAKAPPRERWLTRSEAAKLLKAAWRYREAQNFRGTNRKTRQHLARFILLGLYTGTRSAAICGAALRPTIGQGYIDLDQGLLYRRAPGTAGTNKRQPSVQLSDKLLGHIRRWARRGISRDRVVEFNGKPVKSVKKAFARCVADAGLEGKVTPHTLRHTAISWALQNGADIEMASRFFGVSSEVIRTTYYHHLTKQSREVANAIGRKRA